MTQPGSETADASFLPDFCEARIVFFVVIIGELLAFLLVLAPFSVASDRWGDLALVSMFVQWVGLSSLAVLCLCRRQLNRLGNALAGALSFATILLVTLVLSEAAYRLIQQRLIEVRLSVTLQAGEAAWFAQPAVIDDMLGQVHLEFILRNLGIGAIVGALALRYLYVQYAWRANLESETQARIQALQSRIRPHFLFNCMNTIASFIRSKPAAAEQVVEDLADLFRVSLSDARIPATLSREIEICEQYLRIEEARLGERLTVRWQVEALPRDALLPALSLQPLIENAVYHGIEPAAEGGEIRIEGAREGELVRLLIANTLPSETSEARRTGNRMAQDNVRQRLRAFFGPAGVLEAEAPPGEYRLRVEFPYRRDAS